MAEQNFISLTDEQVEGFRILFEKYYSSIGMPVRDWDLIVYYKQNQGKYEEKTIESIVFERGFPHLPCNPIHDIETFMLNNTDFNMISYKEEKLKSYSTLMSELHPPMSEICAIVLKQIRDRNRKPKLPDETLQVTESEYIMSKTYRIIISKGD